MSRKKAKNTGGRPPFYDTPEQLQSEIDGYFAECQKENDPIVITGLALFLGFSSRQGLSDQEKRSPEFSDIIKKAKLRVENAYERQLYRDKPTGAIFALKHMGWTEDQVRDIRGGMNLHHEGLSPREAALALIAAAKDEGIEAED